MTTVIPFSRYNEEFSSLVTQTRQTLSSISSLLEASKHNDTSHSSSSFDEESPSSPSNHEELKSTLQQKVNLSNQLLLQTKDLLKQMTIESRASIQQDESNKTECQKILQIAKANHANLKDDVTSLSNEVNHYLLTTSSSKARGGGKNKHKVNSEIKEHLLSSNQTLQNTNKTLDRSKQIMADTELIAMEITDELARNRETIESAHSRVRGVGSLSNQARRILVNMNRREVQQKMVVYGVGFVLVLALLFLLGFF